MTTVTLHTLQAFKEAGEKFSCLTAYDATFAYEASSAGVEVLLVGDSLGMVLQGQDSTLPVTLEEMAYHTQCVKRGNQGSLIMVDMPFMSYATPAQAMDSAAVLMQAGAHMLKLEGGAWLAETVAMLTERGIPVCAHLGLTPQFVNKLGGYKVQGRDELHAEALLRDAETLAGAGADTLLLECVPTDLGQRITETVDVPVIGIGAGPHTDGQVLVMHDLLGIGSGRRPKFVKDFLTESGSIQAAFKAYVSAVKSGAFPDSAHSFN